jgi:hypothetical protein
LSPSSQRKPQPLSPAPPQTLRPSAVQRDGFRAHIGSTVDASAVTASTETTPAIRRFLTFEAAAAHASATEVSDGDDDGTMGRRSVRSLIVAGGPNDPVFYVVRINGTPSSNGSIASAIVSGGGGATGTVVYERVSV